MGAAFHTGNDSMDMVLKKNSSDGLSSEYCKRNRNVIPLLYLLSKKSVIIGTFIN